MRSAAGRKREINIARCCGELGSGMRRGTAGRVRTGDWNWNWTAVRPERYIFLNILVTVRNRLVTQPCHLLPAAHYVPTTYQVRAWASPRVCRAVSGFLVTRCRFLSFSLPLSFVTIRPTMARNTRTFSVPPVGAACACVSRVSLYRTTPRL